MSTNKTAFIYYLCFNIYKRIPFGLTNAPATFLRLMNKIFIDTEWNFIFVYPDDVLILSKPFEEHVNHVKKVLWYLKEVRLKLKPRKSAFAQAKIDKLGHMYVITTGTG